MREVRKLSVGRRRDADSFGWALDPTDQALVVSRRRANDQEWLPDALCGEVGRRLLLAELQFSRWMVRRVEKVSFNQDRNVTRRLTIDFNVPDYAPLFVDKVGNRFWLVPLSLMRRRTLVNMRITDENDHVLPTPGIRLAQQLDESILVAATATVAPEPAEPDMVRAFTRELVAGSRRQTKEAMELFEGTKEGSEGEVPPHLEPLAKSPIVRAVVHLIRRNFSLYVFLPAGQRHRLINLEFSEPTGWTRMTPCMTPDGEVREYVHDDRPAAGTETVRAWRIQQARRKLSTGLPAALGLLPTRIRVQVPGAENAASYHLELTAPEGVEVVEARLLAGRPNRGQQNDGQVRYTSDHVVGHTATVGLHGVEVPNGSLCQAQVDFRVTSRGWLTNAVFSCGLVAVVLASLVLKVTYGGASWSTGQVTNIIALLITTSAAVGAMIAHSTFTGVAARMVARLRGLAAVAVAQPIVAAGALAFAEEVDGTSTVQLDGGTRAVLWMATCAALVVFGLIAAALVLSLRCERRGHKAASPWDMTDDDKEEEAKPKTFAAALEKYEFDRSAIGILSAEGWHERYEWTDDKQDAVVKALEDLAPKSPWVTSTPASDRQDSVGDVGDACHHRAFPRQPSAMRRG
ncbi:hypothetical protein [Arthrobacter sp. L77]|uniref:hypothetical protein n=1 Tax=Arthrobacter sp. L77 TaxID=1496689 RepID=UPI000AD2FFF1|nr:hypothetical protein [Arthrobacter sp. L77]